MIKLEDFVSETLRQVMQGVVNAQQHASNIGGSIAPSGARFRNDQGMQLYDKNDGCVIEKIEFNIAVTTTEGTATSGGIGIFVGPVGLGSKGESNSSSQSTSTIKFSVAIKFPPQAV